MSKQPSKRRRIDSKEEIKSTMKELVGEMVPVIVDWVTLKLSQESTVQTGSGTQSQEQDECTSGQNVTPSVPVADVALPTNL